MHARVGGGVALHHWQLAPLLEAVAQEPPQLRPRLVVALRNAVQLLDVRQRELFAVVQMNRAIPRPEKAR